MDPNLHPEKLHKALDKISSPTFVFWNDPELKNVATNSQAIILTGSAARVTDPSAPKVPEFIFRLNKPILAICYGFEYIAKPYIGTFEDNKLHYYNKMLEIKTPFRVPKKLYRFSHHDYVYKLPKKWTIDIIHNDQIWMAHYKNIIGIQFHPEYHESSAKSFYKEWIQFIQM